MNELKPVAWSFQHGETGVISIVDVQQVEWGFEKNNPRLLKVGPLYTIPDTHRVVSVELLKRLIEENIWYATKAELQAIIDTKEAK